MSGFFLHKAPGNDPGAENHEVIKIEF